MSSNYDPRVIKIQGFLKDPEIRKEIRELQNYIRKNLAVTISNVHELLGFSEHQLRNWEVTGLLEPLQTKKKQRRYSLSELNKLAVISVLINKGKFSYSEIPNEIADIWQSITKSSLPPSNVQSSKPPLLEDRLHNYHPEHFWRYFIPRVLRLLLTLIAEELAISTAGIIIPLQRKKKDTQLRQLQEISKVDTSLIGWLQDNHAFYMCIDTPSSSQYPISSRPYSVFLEDSFEQATIFVILPHREKQPIFPQRLIEAIQPFCFYLYRHIEEWQSFFVGSKNDMLELMRDFTQSNSSPDKTLNQLNDAIIELGGRNPDGTNRWYFCCMSIPHDLPPHTQQQSLTVQAQSEQGPYRIGEMTVGPSIDDVVRSISLQALHSGRAIYRPLNVEVSPIETKRLAESEVCSAIALPIGGDHGPILSVIYVASKYPNAFPPRDQRLLRIMSKIIEESITTRRVRLQTSTHLLDLMKNPLYVDPSLGELSTHDFVSATEALLQEIEQETVKDTQEIEAFLASEVAFMGIDVDQTAELAMQYGTTLARNVSKAMYDRIKQEICPFLPHCLLFYAYSNRLYLILRQTSQLKIEDSIHLLRTTLNRDYRVGIQSALIGQSNQPLLTNITVTIAYAHFTYMELKNMLQHQVHQTLPIAICRALINLGLDTALKRGIELGGNKVIMWDEPRNDYQIHT